MCNKAKGCQRPEELKGRPEECPPELIEKCHGEVKEHPCVTTPPRDSCCGQPPDSAGDS